MARNVRHIVAGRWTKVAAGYFLDGQLRRNGPWAVPKQVTDAYYMSALIIIRDHSRKPSTVAEAKRLIEIMEGASLRSRKALQSHSEGFDSPEARQQWRRF